MKLTKKEALDLIILLATQQTLPRTFIERDVEQYIEMFEDFLLSEDFSGEKENCLDCDTPEAHKDLLGDEACAKCDKTIEECDYYGCWPHDEEDDGSNEEVNEITVDELFKLPKIKTFPLSQVNGKIYLSGEYSDLIESIERASNGIYINEKGSLTRFYSYVSKFPKEWTKALKCNVQYKVVG
jgi:hypothetical protein